MLDRPDHHGLAPGNPPLGRRIGQIRPGQNAAIRQGDLPGPFNTLDIHRHPFLALSRAKAEGAGLSKGEAGG